MEKIKTIKDVEIEIRRALLILKALPKEGPRPVRSSWPQMMLEENPQNTNVRESCFYRPMPSEIDDMELVLENWLKVLKYEDRVLILKRISGISWKDLTYIYKTSRSWLNIKYNRGLKAVYDYVMKCQQQEEARR